MEKIEEIQVGTNVYKLGLPSPTLYIGKLVQASVNASGVFTSTSKRVAMHDAIAIPFSGTKFEIYAPEDIVIGLRAGKKIENLDIMTEGKEYWLEDGDTYTFEKDVNYYRLVFAKTDTTQNISLEYVNSLIANNDIKFVITNQVGDIDIISANAENEKYIKAAMLDDTRISQQYPTSKGYGYYPVLAHLTDIHNDYVRAKRFYEYAKYLGVDAIMLTGDYFGNNTRDGIEWLKELSDDFDKPVCISVGNHDVINCSSEQDVYDKSVKYFADRYNYSISGQVGYFYKDIPTNDGKGIRVISINLYEGAQTGGNTNISSTQINWFIATLASTPQDYGVIVLTHAPQTPVSEIEAKAPFCQDSADRGFLWYIGTIVGQPLRDIIDSFISKTTRNGSYTSRGTTISYEADFTNVASGTCFICYLNGHEHEDYVGYVTSATNRQLLINATTSQSVYGGSTAPYQANLSDLPRGGTGSVQDSFNVYVIDRANSKIKILRVGSNFTKSGQERKYLELSFA